MLLKTPIRCITTGEVFFVGKDIISTYPTASHWKDVVEGTRHFAGTLYDGTKLVWEKVEGEEAQMLIKEFISSGKFK